MTSVSKGANVWSQATIKLNTIAEETLHMWKKVHCDGSRIQNNDITFFVKYATSVCSVDIGINHDARFTFRKQILPLLGY